MWWEGGNKDNRVTVSHFIVTTICLRGKSFQLDIHSSALTPGIHRKRLPSSPTPEDSLVGSRNRNLQDGFTVSLREQERKRIKVKAGTWTHVRSDLMPENTEDAKGTFRHANVSGKTDTA